MLFVTGGCLYRRKKTIVRRPRKSGARVAVVSELVSSTPCAGRFKRQTGAEPFPSRPAFDDLSPVASSRGGAESASWTQVGSYRLG